MPRCSQRRTKRETPPGASAAEFFISWSSIATWRGCRVGAARIYGVECPTRRDVGDGSKSAVFSVCRILPVYLDKQTFSEPVGMSQSAKPGSRRSFDRLMRTSTLQKQSVATVCLSRRSECSTQPSLVSIVRLVGLVHRERDSHSAAAGIGSCRRRIWMNCSPARWRDPPSRHSPPKWRLTRVWKPLAAADRSRVFRRMMASVPVNTGGLIRQEQR